ncbi:hypothetical protein BBF96_11035 [Anoxybacter fermentans]|uniref:Flagellar hook-length control protein-like C-terminal domain-containing protein n=1 Tax=Anoxybacter fermentans TaxID=1323375 RepID=A0A3S9T034_9FIRM|nr:flagellar hook-length control protein FliK [Anoxybacter fermentans]AZR73875.1 hypothetical protein BBF96_11035 [Anoxybacter fermentans]
MNGVMGLSQFMINLPNPGEKTSSNAEVKTSFDQIFKQHLEETNDEKSVSDNEEAEFLQSALEYLQRLKLQKLIEMVGQDEEFLAILPEHLKELIKKLQMTGSIDSEMVAVKELNQLWKKDDKVLDEIDKLIAAIEARFKRGTDRKSVNSQMVKNEKLTQFSKKAPVQTESLAKRIFAFLNKIEASEESARSKDLISRFKEKLEEYLNRKQIGIMMNTYYRLNLAKEEMTLNSSVGKKGKETDFNWSLTEKKEQNSQSTFEMLLNDGMQRSDFKVTEHNPTVKEQRFYQPQPEDIFRQMVEKFRLELRQGVSQMEIKLHPEELGRMQLKLIVEEGVVTARFLTETLKVKELIEQNLPKLRETLAKEGIQWDKITVDVSQDELSENPFAYQNQQNLKEHNRGQLKQGEDSFTLTADETIVEDAEDIERVVKDSNRLVDYLA